MKTHALVIQLFGLLVGTSLGLAAANNAVDLKVELKGVVEIGGTKVAYLEFTQPIGGTLNIILREGERMGEIEVLQINGAERKVTISARGEKRVLQFESAGPTGILIHPSSPQPESGDSIALCLEKMGLDQLLILYVALANRTVLRPAQLPACELSLHTRENISKPDLMKAIETALKEKDIVLKPLGNKFLVVARQGDVGLVTPEVKAASDSLVSTLAEIPGSKADELLPPGMINFPSTDINQVLQIYQELINRTIIRPMVLASQTIIFRNAVPLTRSEVIYALTATLALNGISVIPAGEKFVFVSPTAQKEMAKAILARKLAAIAAGTNSIPAGSINLNMAPLGMVTQLYREVSGHELELESGLPDVRILFRNQTPLTPAEALQGFEYALGWNQLVIEKTENKFILKRAGAPRREGAV